MENFCLDKEIYFNQQATTTLASLISGGRLPNTMIIEGEKGSGKKTFAKYIAAAIVCSGKEKPCGNCNNCKKAFGDIHPDIKIIGTQKKQKIIPVDSIREIRSDANIIPNDADRKVYIIADAQNMNREAQNALLKLIEEPPSFAYFILTCNSRGSLLETVVSRAFLLQLKIPSIMECKEYLSHFVGDKQKDELYFAARRSKGNIGRALEILNNPETQKKYAISENIVNACIFGSEYSFLSELSALQNEKDSILDVFMLIREAFSDAFLINSGVKIENPIANKVSETITSLQINQVIDIIDSSIRAIGGNGNKSLVIAWICSQIKSIILG